MSLRSKYQGNLEKSMRGNEVQNNKSEKKNEKMLSMGNNSYYCIKLWRSYIESRKRFKY